MFYPSDSLYVMVDQMTDIMQADAQIDATPDFGIMAGYVKAKLWNTYREAQGPRRAFNDPLGEKLEHSLQHGAPQACRPVLVRLASKGTFSAAVYDLPHDESIVFELWDMFTNDDLPQSKKIEITRDWYKSQLSGCIGVQPSGILRKNLTDYSGESADDLPAWEVYAGE